MERKNFKKKKTKKYIRVGGMKHQNWGCQSGRRGHNGEIEEGNCGGSDGTADVEMVRRFKGCH